MAEGVVREVPSGRSAVGTLGGGGWGGGWGGGDSREWLAIAATAPLPLLALSWALLVSRLHRRLWRPVDVFVAALLSAGIAKQALTLAFALLSLLLLPPDGSGRVADNSGMTEGGWSWDSSGAMATGGTGTREEALCSAAVWGLTSAHALQAAALASLAADRALLALGSRPRRFRAAQARYHVCVLAVISALVGAAGVFARGGSVPPLASALEDDDPCLFLPHQLDSRFALFWICLHGGLLLSGAALAAMVTARLCCCLPRGARRRRGAAPAPEDDSGCCEDEEAPLPVPSPCDTSTAASTASTTASGRSTTALYGAATAAAPTPPSKCGCGDVSMAFRWTEPPPRDQDLRAELRWSTVVSLMALYYLLNHLPVLGLTVLGTFAPWLLPRRWPLGTVVLWAGLAQDSLLPLVLTLSDSRFAGWAKSVYSGATSPASSPSANELRRQHQQQQQLRQQQLEQRRREKQQNLLHQQLQQQLQERRRRLEMTLDSPLPTARVDHEPAYVGTAMGTLSASKGAGEKDASSKGPFHLAPPWKQKNSISVESLFASDLSQQMSPPYCHHTLTSSAPGSTPNSSTVGSGGGRELHTKFPLTNGSLFTVGADGRYPVMRNYRRGSNGGHHSGRIGLQIVADPRGDTAMLPLSSSMRHGGHPHLDSEHAMNSDNSNTGSSNNNFGCAGHQGPRGRPTPIVAPLERQSVINRLEESDSEDEPIYATLSSLEEEEQVGDDEDGEEEDEEDDDEEDDDEEDEERPVSPMSSCSMTTAANDDFEYRDAKGETVTPLGASSRRQEDIVSNVDDDTEEIEEVVFRLPERSVPSALGLYRLRLDELASKEEGSEEGGGEGGHQRVSSSNNLPESIGGALIRSPHNFHRRRYRRVPAHHHHQHSSRRLGAAGGIVLSVDSLQTALSRPDAVAYLDNGERMSGSVPDFKKVFVSEFI